MLKVSKKLIVLFFSLFLCLGMNKFDALAAEPILVSFETVEPIIKLTLDEGCCETEYKKIIADVTVNFSYGSKTETNYCANLDHMQIGLGYHKGCLTFKKCESVFSILEFNCNDFSDDVNGKLQIIVDIPANLTIPLNKDITVCRFEFAFTEGFVFPNEQDNIILPAYVVADETATAFIDGEIMKTISSNVVRFIDEDWLKERNYNHVTGELVEEVPATCTTTGTIEHYTCEKCGKHVSAKDGTTAQEISNLTIKMNNHNIDEESGCVPGVAPSCDKDGNCPYWKCSNCDAIFMDQEGTDETTTASITIAKTGHCHITHVEANEAKCTEAGNNEYWHCEDCGGDFKDKDCTIPANDADIVIDATGHKSVTREKANDATCEKAGNHEYWCCETCEKCYKDSDKTEQFENNDPTIAALGHEFEYEIVDDSYHSVSCNRENCDEEFDNEAHSFVYDLVNDQITCEKCGYIKVMSTAKMIILNRKTQDIIYAETLESNFIKTDESPAEVTDITPKKPERYVWEDYDGDTYTLKLEKNNKYIIIDDYQLLVNGEKQEFGTADDGVYSINIDVTAPTTLVTIEALFDADLDGHVNSAFDAIGLLNTTYRGE